MYQIRDKLRDIVKTDNVRELCLFLSGKDTKEVVEHYPSLWQMYLSDTVCQMAYEGKINCLRHVFTNCIVPDMKTYGKNYIFSAITGYQLRSLSIILPWTGKLCDQDLSDIIDDAKKSIVEEVKTYRIIVEENYIKVVSDIILSYLDLSEEFCSDIFLFVSKARDYLSSH